MSPLMKQVGAEQRTFGFLKENAGVPTMRHVGRGNKSKTVMAGRQDVISRQGTSRPYGKIIYADEGTD